MLIRWALNNRVFPNLLMAGLLVAGLFSLQTIIVKTFPDIDTGTINITVVYPGATPQDVADSIVTPIENAVESVTGVRKVTGNATFGAATILLEAETGADLRRIKDDVENEIEKITVLPEEAEDPQITVVDPDEMAVQYLVFGKKDAVALKNIAVTMREDLLDLEGISDVELSGIPEDQIQIEIPKETLKAYNLSLQEVADIVRAGSLDLSGGVLETEEQRILIRTQGERETADAFRDLVVTTAENGALIQLKDIATIQEGVANEGILTRYQGQSAVLVTVYRTGSEQILQVVDKAQGYVDDVLSPTLDEDVSVVLWRNEASSLNSRIDLLAKNAAIGAGLILLILTLFLDVRIAFWVAVGIIVSFVGAFSFMDLTGITINQLSLFGFILALGVVVDDAIVVGEAIYARQERNGNSREAAAEAAGRMSKPVFFAVFTTIFAFIPLLFLPGSSGSFINQIAGVVIIVLLLSLVESFFILPQHLSHLKQRAPRRWSPRRLTNAMRHVAGGALDHFAAHTMKKIAWFAVRFPIVPIAFSVGLFVVSLGLLSGGCVKFVFFPSIAGDFVSAEIELPEGTSENLTLRKTEQLTEALENVAQKMAERSGEAAESIVEGYVITVGYQMAQGGPPEGGAPQSANAGSVQVKLKPSELRSFTSEQFVDIWKQEVGTIAGTTKLVFSSSVVGVGADIALDVASENDETRLAVVDAITEALQQRQGVFAIRTSGVATAQELEITLKPEARTLGVTLAQLAEAVRAAYFGVTAARVQRDREEVDVRVRLPLSDRDSLADVLSKEIKVGDVFVPIGSLAELSYAQATNVIRRIDGKRVATVSADVNEAVTTGGAETEYIMQTIVPDLQAEYPELAVTLAGEQEEQSRFGPALLRNFVLALFAIYALLALEFQSFFRPIIIILLLPFGFMGALLGHALLGLNLTLLSLFGIIGLAGVMVNDTLLMIDRILENEKSMGPNEAIVDSVQSRFRPIVLTTLTTFFSVFPLILEQSFQAQFLIPTAVSLGFGILVGSIFIVLLTPALSSVYAKIKG
jgi:multidrug efflux pump subunit AcrB